MDENVDEDEETKGVAKVVTGGVADLVADGVAEVRTGRVADLVVD